jgi:hypothetical protein
MTFRKFVRHQLSHSPTKTTLTLPSESVPYSVGASGVHPHVYTLEPCVPRDLKEFVFYVFAVDRACEIPPNSVFLGIAGAVAHHIYWATDE